MNYKKRFLSYLRKQDKKLIFLTIFAFIFVIGQLAQPFLVGKAMDAALELNKNLFIGYIIIAGSLALLGVLAGYLFEYSVGLLTQNIIRDMRNDVYLKMTTVSLDTYHRYNAGDLVQLEIGDIENIANGLFSVFKSLLEGILTIVITIVMMFVVNWILAIAVIVLSPLSVLVSKFIASFSHKSFKKQAELQAELNAMSLETISNSDLVQSLNYEEQSYLSFEKKNLELKKKGTIALFSASWVNPSTRLVNNTIYALIGVFGIIIIYAINGGSPISFMSSTLTIGGLASFLTYTNQYTKPFNEISNVISEYEVALFSFKRLDAFLDNLSQSDNGELEIDKIETIEFDHMYFSYDVNKKLIEDFSEKITKGNKVAIVGPTGAGKTTLVNILMNFYQPISGDIKFNGHSYKEVSSKSLHKSIGMVLQDTWIFKGTILDNVRYGKLDATDEEVKEACKRAHADTFINTLPFGYNTIVSTKEGLSEGQRQMIAIARVMLLKPDIIILDEATSNVDTRSEMLITDAFDEMMKDRTSIVIAHRLSTIRSADTILVLEDGHIIEQGNHKNLMKARGFYYEMYSSQFKDE